MRPQLSLALLSLFKNRKGFVLAELIPPTDASTAFYAVNVIVVQKRSESVFDSNRWDNIVVISFTQLPKEGGFIIKT